MNTRTIHSPAGLTRLAVGLLIALASSISAATLRVWQGSPNPTPPFANWAAAAHTIQDAVDAAQLGDTVLVTNGVYAAGGRAVFGTMTNRVVIAKAILVRSVNGPAVTVIEGARAPGLVPIGDGAIRCASVGNGAVLSGFTLTNGHTRTAGDFDREQCGGGAWGDDEDSGVVTNCVLTGNSAAGDGGGAFELTLLDCVVSGNGADLGGGVFGCELFGCVIRGNYATDGGGSAFGILRQCLLDSNVTDRRGGGDYRGTLHGCVLRHNTACSDGGGAYQANLYGCLVTQNRTGEDEAEGGGAHGGTLYNCTVVGNDADGYGDGVARSRLVNCIVYHNVSDNHYASDVSYSCTWPPPFSGTGNITNEPAFVDLAAGNFRLRPGSPCIDAGTGLGLVTNDLDGVRRPLDGNADCRVVFDMGAYEYQPPSNPGDRVRLTLRGSWPNVGQARGEATDVQVIDIYAYLADGTNGLPAIDVSNPADPDDDYDSLPANAYARALHVVGNYAYLVDGANLRVISLTNPLNPVLVGERVLAHAIFGERLTDVYVSGRYAYVAQTVPEDEPPSSVQVVDVSTPTNPVVVGFFPLFLSVESIHVVGNYAYVSGDEPGFQIFDVSNPTLPVRVGFHATDSGWDIQVAGTNACIADGGGIVVFDVSNPALPRRTASAETDGEGLGVHLAGNYAYVADGDAGVTVLDISNPASPLRAGGYDTCGRARRVDIVGNHAYVADGTGGLLVFEITEVFRFNSIARSDDMLVLTWDGAPGLKLQRTASLTNPIWTDVPGSEGRSHVELPVGAGSEFFRLQKP